MYALEMDRAQGIWDQAQLVAGPIDLSGTQLGFEVNFLAVAVAKLVRY
jgi:hypothetical protein